MRYTRALCRKIPKSIVTNGLRLQEPDTPLDFELALNQQQRYIQALEESGITNITVLETDESVPDCVFVEDAAVVIGNTALITNPGAPSRRPEVAPIKQHFESQQDMRVVSMESPACVDGGDVLFTGKELFVGISTRTNEKGLEVIRETFPNIPVHAIRVGDGTLHLKSVMTMGGNDLILCGESENASAAKEMLRSTSKFVYDMVSVPDDYAANCLFINGVLIHRSSEEFPACAHVWEGLNAEKVISLNLSELSKVDGALTCCSVLY